MVSSLPSSAVTNADYLTRSVPKRSADPFTVNWHLKRRAKGVGVVTVEGGEEEEGVLSLLTIGNSIPLHGHMGKQLQTDR